MRGCIIFGSFLEPFFAESYLAQSGFWYMGLGPQGKRSFHKKVAVLELGGSVMFPFAFFMMYCTFEENDGWKFWDWISWKMSISFPFQKCVCTTTRKYGQIQCKQSCGYTGTRYCKTINITSKQCRPPSASPHHNMDDLGQWVWVWSQNEAFRFSIMVIFKEFIYRKQRLQSA